MKRIRLIRVQGDRRWHKFVDTETTACGNTVDGNVYILDRIGDPKKIVFEQDNYGVLCTHCF